MKSLICCYVQNFCAFNDIASVHNTAYHDDVPQFCQTKFKGASWEPLLLMGFKGQYCTFVPGKYADPCC